MDLLSFKEWFNPSFEKQIKDFILEEKAILQDSFLEDILKHSDALLKNGKRIRPYLAWMGYAIGKGDDQERIREMGNALEIFHCFCLIHDDIIDKAQTRRGEQTIEARAHDMLYQAKRHGDQKHTARSHAILVGDLLFAWAMECAIRAGREQPQALKTFSQMIKEVVGGQMIDVDTTTREEHDLNLLERKMYLKTAGYSFVHPLCIGLILAQSPEEERLIPWLKTIGTSLGIAFQLQDDLFDVTSTEEVLGKPVLEDIREGQQTFLTTLLAKKGSEEEQKMLAKIMKGKGTEEEIQKIKNAFEERGVCGKVSKRIKQLIEEARTAITAAPFPPDIQKNLLALTEILEHRTS